jgi:hypothetical protein
MKEKMMKRLFGVPTLNELKAENRKREANVEAKIEELDKEIKFLSCDPYPYWQVEEESRKIEAAIADVKREIAILAGESHLKVIK